MNELKIDQLNKEVQAALLAGDNTLASQKVEALLLLKPISAWQRADIADALRMTGQSERANRLMAIWANNNPDPEMRFAYALYLSRNGQLNAAVAELEKIDIAQRSPVIERNLARLKLDLELGDIKSLFLVQPFEAEQQLKLLSINYKSNPEAMMRIASTWVELLQPTKAITIFDELIFDKQWPFSTQLSYGELIVKLQKYHEFDQWIKQFNGDGLSSSEYSTLRQLNTRRYLSEADSKMLTGNYAKANHLYTVVSMQAGPLRTDGQIGVLQSSVLLQTSSQYSKLAEDLYAKRMQLTAKQLVDVAVVFNQIDRKNQANTLNSILLTKHDAEAMDYRDAMSVAMVNHEWGMADTLAYQALNSDRIEKSKTPLQVNEEKPELRELYDNADDYWLTRNVKRDIDKLRDRNDGHVVFGFDYSGRDGENTAFQIPIEARIPIAEYNGHLLIRIDSVSIRSGELEYFNKTSAENVTEAIDQSAFGTALGVGWEAETWSADIGTTPIGFDHATWVGGVNLNGDIRDFGWNATLSRRPETSSMLSYAGLSVPSGSPPAGSLDQEGTEWGGVVRTGVKLGGSYDIGGPTGFWSSLQYHQITGEKVEDNTRIGLLGGGYYKLIAEDDERLSLGMNLMYLTYDKNLSEYTLGHGGYYSPQSYFSISLPVNYYGRFDNTWAYLFNGSISNSWTKEDAPYLFTSDSSTGGGFGYSFLAALEKRVSKRWYIGASLDLQRSDFYEPNHFILYARYTFNDRWQLIPTPPNTPLLYSGFD
ncbi:BCSC C-terminal domain-containing protein [Photobacterium indicum]